MDMDALQWNGDGLIPVVITDVRTGDVLSLSWSNRKAIEKTIETRETYLWNAERSKIERHGEKDGNTQRVVEVRADCEGGALLYRVAPNGPACAAGEPSCFHETVMPPKKAEREDIEPFISAIAHLSQILEERRRVPLPDSYLAKLYERGVDRIGKKLGEEAVEVVIAAKNEDDAELVWESADLIFHILALLAYRNIPLSAIGDELLTRKVPKAQE